MNSQILLEILFGGIGGLGIFLLGMKNMSEGMQAVAGDELRRLIGAVTNNRFLATGVGVVVTCVVQSSSITTVMVVGFVNSGLMTLTQAIGVIMGANIGTTITGWVLVLKIGKYGLPLLGTMAFVYLFSRTDRWRYWAMTLMGVGMVFFGLELMKDACAHIKDLPDFEAWLQRFRADNYFGVMKCALIGCVLTMMVQSSSATLGITISLAYQGIIPFETAAALVLGENIGTTITAYLASLGATTNARRAAYFHVLFNLMGVFWITLVFPWYIQLVHQLLSSPVTETAIVENNEVYPQVTAAIALTHSLFNIANTLLFLPFLPFCARLLERIVKEKGFKEKPHLTDLDIRMLETPLIAIEQSRREVLHMGEGCHKMMDWLKGMLEAGELDPQLVEKSYNRERILDSIQHEVAHFITDLLSSNVPHRVAAEGRQQIRLAEEYESISDYLTRLLKSWQKLKKKNKDYSTEQRQTLLELHGRVENYLIQVTEGYRKQNPHILAQTEDISSSIRKKVKKLHQAHLTELEQGQLESEAGITYTQALNNYRRVRDHCLNIAEALTLEK